MTNYWIAGSLLLMRNMRKFENVCSDEHPNQADTSGIHN